MDSRFIAWTSAFAIVTSASLTFAQDYPTKPIRIVTVGIGGNSDLVSRLVAQGITGALGQPVIVENRNNINPALIVLKAPPDGYTLLISGGVFAQTPLLRDEGYDPIRDFAPISAVTMSPSLIAVHPSVAANSIKELIAIAKAKPGVLNYGSSGIASGAHIATELFKSMAGVDIVHIPYKTAGDQTTALITNQVQMLIATPGLAMPHAKAGRLRALAITSAEPSALAPGLPTVSASGLPGYDVNIVTGMYAPAKTPVVIINRLNREVARFLNNPDMKQKFLDLNVDAGGGSPQQLEAQLKSQITQWRKVIKDAGIIAQ